MTASDAAAAAAPAGWYASEWAISWPTSAKRAPHCVHRSGPVVAAITAGSIGAGVMPLATAPRSRRLPAVPRNVLPGSSTRRARAAVAPAVRRAAAVDAPADARRGAVLAAAASARAAAARPAALKLAEAADPAPAPAPARAVPPPPKPPEPPEGAALARGEATMPLPDENDASHDDRAAAVARAPLQSWSSSKRCRKHTSMWHLGQVTRLEKTSFSRHPFAPHRFFLVRFVRDSGSQSPFMCRSNVTLGSSSPSRRIVFAQRGHEMAVALPASARVHACPV
mmetsp:Transcript_73288/g.203103  ORF Transcript_73288/g.203103 Transcript_73288/m.203103 type:complete len:282 (-) Transcript_73288:159-1004(-)